MTREEFIDIVLMRHYKGVFSINKLSVSCPPKIRRDSNNDKTCYRLPAFSESGVDFAIDQVKSFYEELENFFSFLLNVRELVFIRPAFINDYVFVNEKLELCINPIQDIEIPSEHELCKSVQAVFYAEEVTQIYPTVLECIYHQKTLIRKLKEAHIERLTKIKEYLLSEINCKNLDELSYYLSKILALGV